VTYSDCTFLRPRNVLACLLTYGPPTLWTAWMATISGPPIFEPHRGPFKTLNFTTLYCNGCLPENVCNFLYHSHQRTLTSQALEVVMCWQKWLLKQIDKCVTLYLTHPTSAPCTLSLPFVSSSAHFSDASFACVVAACKILLSWTALNQYLGRILQNPISRRFRFATFDLFLLFVILVTA